MTYTLGTAAKATGKSKSTIQRAIKSGRISASREGNGSYSIEPSELHRIYPATVAEQAIWNDTQPQAEPAAILKIKVELLEEQLSREREVSADTITDLRGRLDRAEGRVSALTDQRVMQGSKSWWSRTFGK